MMSDAVITGIITGAVAIVVCMINNYFQHQKTVSLIEYRLKQLEDKVGKHNNLDGRLLVLEGEEKVMLEKIKVANHRIDDLEERV